MDVTCERCGTEYEFDETLVSDRGTTVKCTNCGHLFKVFRPGTEPSAAAAPEQRSWTLESATGGTQQIASLKELQRLITTGEVTAEDRISRAGEGQKRLGDIAELATFFAAARPKSVRPAPAATRPGQGPSARPPAPAAPTPPPPARPVPAPPRGKGTMLGMGQNGGREQTPAAVDPTGRTVEMRAPTAPAETLRNVAPPPAQESPPPPRRPQAASVRPPPTRETPYTPPPAEVDDAPEPPRRGDSSQRLQRPDLRSQRSEPTDRIARPSQRERLRVDDDDEDIPPPPQRSYTGVFLGVVLLAAIGVGGYFGWPTIQRMIAGTPPAAPGAEFIAQGDEALARDRDDAYRDAASFYTKALALDEHSARVLTGLSRAHALIAQNRLFQAEELDARAAAEPAAAGEASALRREASGDAEDAREHAESAIRQEDGADAEVALADALRLAGDANAQSRLDRALTLATSPSAEALRVRALLEAQRGGGLAAAVDSAERAVGEDPSSLRDRLLLARAQLAAGNPSAARAQVQSVLDRDPEHPDAIALRTRIEAAGGTLPDAGTIATPQPLPPPTSAVTPPPPQASVVAPPTTTTTTTPSEDRGSSSSGGTAHGDYDSLVHQADAQLENAHAERARPLYEAALRQRPGGSEALTGMGFVQLDAGNASAAVGYFRQASSAGYGHAYIGLGSAYRQMHDINHALEAYEAYLARNPSGAEASIARRQADLLRAQGAHGSGGAATPPATTTHEDPAPESDTPTTHESTLPAPRGSTTPPPSDVPALDSEP